MNKQQTFNEAIEILKAWGEVIIVTDEYEYSVQPATEFGGSEDCFICDAIGMIEYDSEEEVVWDLVELIFDEVKENVLDITVD